MPSVSNIVATNEVDRQYDVSALYSDLSAEALSVDYDPETTHWLIIKPDDVSVTALVSRDAKFTITGAQTEDEVEDGYKAVYDAFVNIDALDERPPIEYEVTNIVATEMLSDHGIDPPLNLNALAIAMGLENIEYEPEQFPGLIYPVPGTSCVALVFGNAKVTLVGGRTEEEVRTAVGKLTEKIEEYML